MPHESQNIQTEKGVMQMTSKEVIKIIHEYLEIKETDWEFLDLEDLEMSAFNTKICQYGSDLEDTIELVQAVYVTLDNELISRASAQLDFEPEKMEELEKYLDECSEQSLIKFSLDYDEEENEYYIVAGLYIDFTKDGAEKKLTDEEYLDAILNWPIEALQEEWQELEDLFQRLLSAEEAPELRKEIRYYMEHVRLPQDYFNGQATEWEWQFTQEVLYDYAKNLSELNGLKMPYQKTDYHVSVESGDKGYTLRKITLPEPEEQPLCKEIYLMYNDDCSKQMYFTLERGETEKEYILASWDKQKKHTIYEMLTSGQRNVKGIMEEVFWGHRESLIGSRYGNMEN